MTLRTRSLRNIFNSKVPSPRTTTAFELPSSQACRPGRWRLFSRLQSTVNPSPSSEGGFKCRVWRVAAHLLRSSADWPSIPSGI